MDSTYDQLSDDEAVALISAAVRQILSERRVIPEKVQQDIPSWRFSGRWWNDPVVLRRSRPDRH